MAGDRTENSDSKDAVVPTAEVSPVRTRLVTPGSLLAILFGGGAVMVVLALFLTGLAQREIIPRIQARAEDAMNRAKERARPPAKAEPAPAASAAADSTRTAPADSLAALSTQMETQRTFLEGQKQELARMRAALDSASAARREIRGEELAKQAKLLAGMKPLEAARILSAMDDASVSALLGKMNARAASKVMAQLDAGRMARLTLAAIGESGPVPAKGGAPSPAAPPGPANETTR